MDGDDCCQSKSHDEPGGAVLDADGQCHQDLPQHSGGDDALHLGENQELALLVNNAMLVKFISYKEIVIQLI